MKKYALVALSAALALVVAAPAAGSTPKAQIATKQAAKALNGDTVAQSASLRKCLNKANRIENPVKRKKAKRECKKKAAQAPVYPSPTSPAPVYPSPTSPAPGYVPPTYAL